MPTPSEFVGVPPGATADVEHAVARPRAEHVDDVVDLLHRSLRERVPVVRLAHVIGERLEPMVAHRRRLQHASGQTRDVTYPLAAAHV